jgi:hypothetical protein
MIRLLSIEHGSVRKVYKLQLKSEDSKMCILYIAYDMEFRRNCVNFRSVRVDTVEALIHSI